MTRKKKWNKMKFDLEVIVLQILVIKIIVTYNKIIKFKILVKKNLNLNKRCL